MPPGAEIKLPSMPGTRHNAPLQSSFRQRTAGMRADAVQSKHRVSLTKDGDNAIGDDKLSPCPFGNVIDAPQPMPHEPVRSLPLIAGMLF